METMETTMYKQNLVTSTLTSIENYLITDSFINVICSKNMHCRMNTIAISAMLHILCSNPMNAAFCKLDP